MFEAFYASFWQHPLLLWLFPALYLVLVRPRGAPFELACLVFALLTILDPLFTGPLPEFFGWSEGVASAVMIVFVLLGDFRFFYFIEVYGREGTRSSSARRSSGLARAAALTFIVPLLQAALIKIFPGQFAEPRHTFLAYELLFLGLALGFRFAVLPRRDLDREVRRWLNAVCQFGIAYYALWATADVIILSGADVGYLVRVVPNVLYYGLFIPFVFWKAPSALKRARAKGKAT